MAAAGLPLPGSAQDAAAPPERIDILVPQQDYDAPLEDCSDEQEAASISGDIIVCRTRRDQREFGYDEERALQRYAAETMNRGDPRARLASRLSRAARGLVGRRPVGPIQSHCADALLRSALRILP